MSDDVIGNDLNQHATGLCIETYFSSHISAGVVGDDGDSSFLQYFFSDLNVLRAHVEKAVFEKAVSAAKDSGFQIFYAEYFLKHGFDEKAGRGRPSVPVLPFLRLCGEEKVIHPTGLCFLIPEANRHARTQHRDQLRRRIGHHPLATLHKYFFGCVHFDDKIA